MDIGYFNNIYNIYDMIFKIYYLNLFQDKIVCKRLRSILCGEQTIKHHMQFLIKNNHTDMLILKQIKESVRTASAHNATVISNGLMHLGTTTDDFLRYAV